VKTGCHLVPLSASDYLPSIVNISIKDLHSLLGTGGLSWSILFAFTHICGRWFGGEDA